MEDKSMQEIKDMAISIARLEENTKHISEQMTSVLKLVSETPAMYENVRIAHKRIDDMEKSIVAGDNAVIALVNKKDEAQDERISKVEDTQKWQGRTILAAIIVGVINKFFL
jgi:hypothetical protein